MRVLTAVALIGLFAGCGMSPPTSDRGLYAEGGSTGVDGMPPSEASDSGKVTDFCVGSISPSDEFTSRKNTRMVKISINDTRLIPVVRPARLWWRSMRSARRERIMFRAPFGLQP